MLGKTKYEEAAKLRDDENALKRLAIAQEQWEDAKKQQNRSYRRQCC
jgi:hypothetical protein